MDSVKWTDVWQAYASIGNLAVAFCALVVAAFGLWAVWLQVRQVKVQVRQVNQTVAAETHSKLYDHYTNVVGMLLEHPHLRAYLYDGAPLEKTASNELKSQCDTMCELMAGLLEHAWLQHGNLPPSSWRQCWMQFIKARIQESPSLQVFLDKNKEWYVKEFRDYITKATKDVPQAKAA